MSLVDDEHQKTPANMGLRPEMGGAAVGTSHNSAAFNALMGTGTAQDADESAYDDADSDAADSDADSNAFDEGEAGDDVAGDAQSTTTTRKGVLRLVPIGTIVVTLLKGYIERDDNKVLFESLVRQQLEVETLCRTLFLQLIVDNDAGYAYVRSVSEEELPNDVSQRPPRLLSRKPLPFYDSLILILLRQRLLDFDMSGQFGRLVLERSEILTLVKTFIRQVNNDKRLDDNINKAIDNLCALGLLSKNKSGKVNGAKATTKAQTRDMERIEVRRIISVIVSPEVLKQADETLESYLKHIKEGGRAKNRLSSGDDDDDDSNLM